VRLRYFDALERRPGLPADVAALVSALDAESTTVELINTNPSHERRLIIQAGAFGEHNFTSVELENGDKQAIDGQHFAVTLPPGRSICMKLGMDRYANTPSYAQPV
jgi:hypothetical protein